MQKLAHSHGLAPEGFLSQLQIVLAQPEKHSPTSLMKIVDKTCCMAGLETHEMGFKYKAKLISKMRKLAKVAWWAAPHWGGDSREFNLTVHFFSFHDTEWMGCLTHEPRASTASRSTAECMRRISGRIQQP